jgi:hypothetical protein
LLLRCLQYLQEVLVGAGLALFVVGIDVRYHHPVQGVVPAGVVLSEAELVDCVAGVEFLSAKGDEVVYMDAPSLEGPPRCKVEITGHLHPESKFLLRGKLELRYGHKDTWRGLLYTVEVR